MKRLILLSGLFLAPFLICAQIQDSIALNAELDSLLELNRTLLTQFKLKEAQPVIESAKLKSEQAFGKNSDQYADAMFGYGSWLQKSGKLPEAEAAYLEVMAIREPLQGRVTLDYAKVLNNLGSLYFYQGKLAKAEELFQESLSTREKVSGKMSADYAKMVNNLGTIYLRTGNAAKAESMFLEAREIWGKTLGTDHPEYANSVHNLGAFYQTKGQLEKAEPFVREGLNIRKKTLGINHPDYAQSLGNLAAIYKMLNRYESAIQYFEEALAIYEKNPVMNSLDLAMLQTNLAVTYVDLGEYEKAKILYKQSKGAFAATSGKKDPIYSVVLNNLANLYYLTGDLDAAEIANQEALDFFESAGRTISKDFMSLLISRGNILMAKSEYASAEEIYQKCFALLDKTNGRNNYEHGAILANLASVYRATARLEQALQAGEEAINILSKSTGEHIALLASVYSNMAIICHLNQQSDKAIEYAKKSVQTAHLQLDPGNPEATKAVYNLAGLYDSYGFPDSASVWFIQASVSDRKNLLSFSRYATEPDLLKFIKHYKTITDGFLSYVWRNPDIPTNLVAAYENTMFQKRFVEVTSRSIQNMIEADSALNDLNGIYKSYMRNLSKEYAKSLKEQNKNKLTEWEDKADSCLAILTLKLSSISDDNRMVAFSEVQNKLQAKTAALEFVQFNYAAEQLLVGNAYSKSSDFSDSVLYAALLLLPNDTTPHFVPLFEERQLQPLLNRPGLSDEDVVKDLYGNRPELAQLLWAPLEPWLRDVKTVYYSPSGLLHRINPAALLDAGGESIASGRAWVRLGSTRELVTNQLADQSYAQSGAETPLAAIYGGIQYEMDSTAFVAINPADLQNGDATFRKDGKFRYIASTKGTVVADGIVVADGVRGADGDWEALPATAKEADDVGALLRKAGYRTELKKGLGASEEHLKKLGANGQASPRILHLATHGFAYPDPKKEPPKGFGDNEPTYKLQDDPMLRSGLLLAGSNFYWKNKRPLEGREDGVLVAYEVRDLNLRNTELAVLSACQTGLGDVVGAEGVYGLQRAFRIAGAKFLIVSLWQVPDAKTQELMNLFYQNYLLKKEPLRTAFNHAQEAMRRKDPNPFGWAGFVLIE